MPELGGKLILENLVGFSRFVGKVLKLLAMSSLRGFGEKVLAMQSNDFGTVYLSCSLGIR